MSGGQDKIRVSIIITARNYGRYLKECIESCINQTIRPYEIIYSDDFSEDDSVEAARKFQRVKVVTAESWKGVIKARTAGVEESKGNVLVHVDGDDLLPEDFLEKHLQVFDESTPFVYGGAQAFGWRNCYWKAPNWGAKFLFNRNFINTSMMVWRDKFLEAGGWQETPRDTMWDWSLAIRLSRLGTPKRSPAVLRYRQHESNWGVQKQKLDFEDTLYVTRMSLVKMAVGLVYSGRLAELFPEWMQSLIADTQFLVHKPQLIIVDNSEGKLKLEDEWYPYFSEIKVIQGPGIIKFESEIDRRNKVSELLAECYNYIIENSDGDILHMREDDIIGYEQGLQTITEFIAKDPKNRSAAAGLYFNRATRWGKFVGGWYNTKDPRKNKYFDKVPSAEPFIVDFTGTGFIVFWKELCPKLYEPYVDGIQAHDWAWSLKLKKAGGSLWMLPDVICKHHLTKEMYVVPPPDALDLPSVATFTQQVKEEKVVQETKRVEIRK